MISGFPAKVVGVQISTSIVTIQHGNLELRRRSELVRD